MKRRVKTHRIFLPEDIGISHENRHRERAIDDEELVVDPMILLGANAVHHCYN